MTTASLLDEHGQIREPLLGVELNEGEDIAVPVTDRILVGVAPHGASAAVSAVLDLTLVPHTVDRVTREQVAVADPQAALAALRTAAVAHPQAAIVLAGLLRRTATQTVLDALDAESFAYSTLLGGREFRAWLDGKVRRSPRPASGDPVLVARDGDELHVTLNRPERRNAYSAEVRDALVAALEIALLDPGVRRVVLDGAGPAFSAGGDLDEFGTSPDLATAHLVRTRAGAAAPLYRLGDRVEARLHGACVGAGIELPAFAARVIARPGTTFRLPEVGMGLIPGAGGTVGIPRRIGRWRTLYLALTGTALDTETALDWGLVDDISTQ
jgi:enoyl-CoA hydratase/carnithine racemase